MTIAYLSLPEPSFGPHAHVLLKGRYLRDDGCDTPSRMLWRVGETASHARSGADRDAARRYYRLMASVKFVPNSPALFNAQTDAPVMLSTFVFPLDGDGDGDDALRGAIEANRRAQAAGGGCGFDLSVLDPSMRWWSGHDVRRSGTTPIDALHRISAASSRNTADAVRPGANMGVLRVDHPDIIDFVDAKRDTRMIQNFNISVAITDRFIDDLFERPDAAHTVVHPRTGERARLVDATDPTERPWTVRGVWARIVENAHAAGEPGLLFIDRINRLDPLSHLGPIHATNSCGEQALRHHEGACLGSINLTAHTVFENGRTRIDWDGLGETTALAVELLDDLIEVSAYPTGASRSAAMASRRIGVGVMGFADLLFVLGLPYDSQKARGLAARVMAFVSARARAASQRRASRLGCFGAWEGSDWHARGVVMRNAYVTCIAPTGSISMLAGCSQGIEPVFSLVTRRRVLARRASRGSVITVVNPLFREAAIRQRVWTPRLEQHLVNGGSVRDADVPDVLKRVFVTAHDVSAADHLRMQMEFQAHCDAGVAKTVNAPRDASLEDIRSLFELAARSGQVKGITVYRDGCRDDQPMSRSA